MFVQINCDFPDESAFKALRVSQVEVCVGFFNRLCDIVDE